MGSFPLKIGSLPQVYIKISKILYRNIRRLGPNLCVLNQNFQKWGLLELKVVKSSFGLEKFQLLVTVFIYSPFLVSQPNIHFSIVISSLC